MRIKVVSFIILVFSGLILFLWVFLRHRYFFRAVKLTILRGKKTSSIDDFKYFPTRLIKSGKPSFLSESGPDHKIFPDRDDLHQWETMGTVALLVAVEGRIAYENYWQGHQPDTLSNSFSMAKSVVVMLLGCALKDGYIKSLDDPVSGIFSQYSEGMASRLTIRDLARMSSGMDWQEEYYLPFNVTTQAYYGAHLDDLILNRRIVKEPGESFVYLSGNTQLLALVLSKVLPCVLSEYLSRKIWQPMGMESDARWMIDESSGIERAFCCINATARDFLRLGQLLLQKGKWESGQILEEDFVRLMTTPGFDPSPQYGYGMWLDMDHDPPFYMMRGHLGQYVIVIPSLEVVITRLGKWNSPKEVEDKQIPLDVYTYIRGVLDAL